MWNEADFRTKARSYFEYAERNDETISTFIWAALGLEFLLRAPLASVNPVLLADPNASGGHSVLHAAGVPQPGNREPTSVAISTVLQRIPAIVPGFTSDDENDARFIINLRNRELHSADMSMDDAPLSMWLPRFHRVIERVSAYFGETPTDYLSADFVDQATQLVAEEDKKIEHAVKTKISGAAAIYGALTDPEREARRQIPVVGSHLHWTILPCPACSFPDSLIGTAVRAGREEIDGDTITKTIHYVANSFRCRVCNLQLDGVAELSAAGLPQTWQTTEFLSLAERLEMDDFEPDYGND